LTLTKALAISSRCSDIGNHLAKDQIILQL
jgi:hypothetical protein